MVSQKWRTGGVLILECEDVAVQGLTVDYDPPAFYQGTVTSLEAGSAAASAGPPAAAAAATAACYRRMELDVSQCAKGQTTALHEYDRSKSAWRTLPGLNCYPGVGVILAFLMKKQS